MIGLLAIVYALARARPWREFLADHRLWICALVLIHDEGGAYLLYKLK